MSLFRIWNGFHKVDLYKAQKILIYLRQIVRKRKELAFKSQQVFLSSCLSENY